MCRGVCPIDCLRRTCRGPCRYGHRQDYSVRNGSAGVQDQVRSQGRVRDHVSVLPGWAATGPPANGRPRRCRKALHRVWHGQRRGSRSTTPLADPRARRRIFRTRQADPEEPPAEPTRGRVAAASENGISGIGLTRGPEVGGLPAEPPAASSRARIRMRWQADGSRHLTNTPAKPPAASRAADSEIGRSGAEHPKPPAASRAAASEIGRRRAEHQRSIAWHRAGVRLTIPPARLDRNPDRHGDRRAYPPMEGAAGVG